MESKVNVKVTGTEMPLKEDTENNNSYRSIDYSSQADI